MAHIAYGPAYCEAPCPLSSKTLVPRLLTGRYHKSQLVPQYRVSLYCTPCAVLRNRMVVSNLLVLISNAQAFLI